MEQISIELARAIGRFFLHPTIYVALLFSILIGYFRVKRERKQFKTRMQWGWTEATHLFEGYIWAIILSVVSVGVGLVVPSSWLFITSAWMLLFIVIFTYQLGSVIYPIALGAVTLYVMYVNDWSFNILGNQVVGMDLMQEAIVTIAILAGLLLIVEGILIQKHGARHTSPKLVTTARGGEAIEYVTKRLWILPVLLVVPGDIISTYLPYWPQFTLGNTNFSLLLFPFILGFQQKSRHSLPILFFQSYGKKIWQLGILITVISAIGYVLPLISGIAIISGVVARLVVSFITYKKEMSGTFAVAPQTEGVMIAAVLSDSPAEKMGLLIGERITKVNGQKVTNEQEFYEAVQINAAHCRLEVKDHRGELRLRQHILFRHDHYRLGLILVR